MKRERVQFLVTVSLGYDTRAERREAIAAARENLLAVSEGRTARPVKATLVKRDPSVSEWLMPVPRTAR